MSLASLLEQGLADDRPLRLAATDIAGYLRLEQCERYLRFQLAYRNGGDEFLRELDVAPRPLPALLTGSGAGFEAAMLAQIAARTTLIDCASERTAPNDNQRLLDLLRRIEPGAPVALAQPRLHVNVAGWSLRGDLDLLIIERDATGTARLTLLDMKSSADSRVEHKIQVAIYAAMIESLCARAGFAPPVIRSGIVFRGASDPAALPPDAQERLRTMGAAAEELGLRDAYLDLIDGDALYPDAVDDLVFGEHAVARAISAKSLPETAFAFSARCDGCFFNEACLRIAHDRDDLALIPFMELDAKQAFARSGISTTAELAALKVPGVAAIAGVERRALVPADGRDELCHDLADQRAVAGRLDELVARARRYHDLPGARASEGTNLIGAGYGTLPYSDPEHDPNLVRIYVDIQRDYLHDRVYLASALVQANREGVADPERRRAIVRLTDGPPATPEIERLLLIEFISGVLRAVFDLAAPDEAGEANAPIHLIFYERGVMTALLQALGRNSDAVLGATALYDFISQQPAFDSPLVTMLAEEIRTLKNYPLLAPSLQAVARYLQFDWDAERPLTSLFRSGLFDDARPVAGADDAWFTGRARFSSAIPLEYAYATWGALPPVDESGAEASFRRVERDDLLALAGRRLEAMEAIAADFRGNDRSYKARFALPDLALFQERATTIATGIEEFILTERHVELGAWRSARQPTPEQRMSNGDSLVVRYLEADQAPGVAEANRGHRLRQRRQEELRDAWAAAHPNGEKLELSNEEKAETRWRNDGIRFSFEVLHPGGKARIERVLGSSEIKPGARVLIAERWSVDTRWPVDEQFKFQTTARQLLYGKRATVVELQKVAGNDGETRTLITLEMTSTGGVDPGFVFYGRPQTFAEGELYTIETDPNSIALSRGRKVALALQNGVLNGIAERLAEEELTVTWPAEAAAAQARFLAGMDAFADEGDLHRFEPEKRRYIGALGDAPTILVQGPPGTGKSYTTAFAIWARVQGAIAAGIPLRALISCKTHAATDVLLRNVAEVRDDLNRFRQRKPELFDRYFDRRLIETPLFRFDGRGEPPYGVRAIYRKSDGRNGGAKAVDLIAGRDYSIIGLTPGGSWTLASEANSKDRFAVRFTNLLVLDEASQMSLPEAMQAAMTLELDGQLIVVGDHRQMPPIVQHDWASETRRSFRRFAAYESLYLALDRTVEADGKIKFAESFRLHRDMAEFLRREIYRYDGIDFFSRRATHVDLPPTGDPFADAVLGPEPLVVVIHDEAASETSNPFEQGLIDCLASRLDGFDLLDGLGIVVPHRAQRANLQEGIPALTRRNENGAVVGSSVDTVERFQGDERRIIVVSLTQSDPQFIRRTSEFLLDPRRLTVALSRAREKLIVIASRSVFGVISPDEETFANAGLWKNLLRRTCTETRWSGEIDGHAVEVRVNPPLTAAK